MMDAQKNKKLFSQFNNFNDQDWVNEAVKKLKDQNFQSLHSTTYEGIELKPFYTSSDQVQTLLASDFHYPRHWASRENIRVQEVEQANQIAQEAINQGVNALQFDLCQAESLNLEELIKNIPLNNLAVGFNIYQDIPDFLTNIPERLSRGTFNYDFLSLWAQTGKLPEEGFKDLSRLVLQTSNQAGIKSLVITGAPFYNSGANAVQELAFALALFVEYLDQLTEIGIMKESIFHKVEFSMAIGSNYFMEIAKFRALRLLWNHLSLQTIKDYAPCYLHTQTAIWHKTVTGPYNNMLRNTTQAMSAIIGGCDALSIDEHQEAFAPSDAFSRRVARNVSTILREESFFDKVSDVSAGSYFIEHLTLTLAEKAWELFQSVESKGGFIKAFQAGFIQDEIEKLALLKKQAVKEVRDVVVGTNKYQNQQESLVSLPDNNSQTNNKGLKLLKPQRLVEEIERDFN